MNLDKILELTPKIQETAKQLKAMWTELSIAMTGEVGDGHVSNRQLRRMNNERKRIIIEFFNTHPLRGFTFRDLKEHFKDIPTDALSGFLKYFVNSKALEKVGEAYRLYSPLSVKAKKAPTPAQVKQRKAAWKKAQQVLQAKRKSKKPKRTVAAAQGAELVKNLSPEKMINIKDDIIKLTKKHPKEANKQFFQQNLPHNYYVISYCCEQLMKDGILKENVIEGTTATGAKWKFKRFAVI